MTRHNIPPGVLAEAARQPVKAGGAVQLPASPAAVRSVSIGNAQLPYDIVPSSGNKRAVQLGTEAHHARVMSLTVSYQAGFESTPSSTTDLSNIPIPVPMPPRNHAVVVSFGVGGALHTIEADIAEGTVITLPTQTVEVELCHYGSPRLDPLPPVALESQASAAYGPAVSCQAVKTQRALMPLGLSDGPGIEDAFAGNLDDVPLLRDALSNEDVEASFSAALTRLHDAGSRRRAYLNALDRVAAILPPGTGSGVL